MGGLDKGARGLANLTAEVAWLAWGLDGAVWILGGSSHPLALRFGPRHDRVALQRLDDYLEAQLDAMRERDLFRDPDDAHAREVLSREWHAPGTELLDATTNDYLGLAAASVSRETARLGAGASRLVQGTWPEHLALERSLADWVGAEDALVFTSGYAANVGTVAALAGPDSAVLSDALNHASLIDGCRLSRGMVAVVPHLDLRALETALVRAAAAPLRWVVTESYFSMDGDGPDLGVLRALCDRYRAFLVVDEAHALGVFGPAGAGRCAAAGIKPDVLIGTLGKSVGSQGAFVAGSSALTTFLWNRARSFVFSTAPSPRLCADTLAQVEAARAADASRQHLAELAELARSELSRARVGLVPHSFGPIVSVLAGPSARALEAAQALRDIGILAQPIRPPTVPEGLARLRLTLSARWSAADVRRLVSAVARILGEP